MMAVQEARKQIVAYVEGAIKEELAAMKSSNRRLSESLLIEEALLIAMPTLRERHSFKSPAQATPGRKKPAA